MYERYKDPKFLVTEGARVAKTPSIQHIFNAGAYRIGVAPEHRDPQIEGAMDALAAESQHTLDRQKIIARELGIKGPIKAGTQPWTLVSEQLQNPLAGLDAVPDKFKADLMAEAADKAKGDTPSLLDDFGAAPTREQTNLSRLMGMPRIQCGPRAFGDGPI